MPTNKNALTRYKYLDELLSDRHHFFDIHDLTDRVNEKLITSGLPEVTQRCIEKDNNSSRYLYRVKAFLFVGISYFFCKGRH